MSMIKQFEKLRILNGFLNVYLYHNINDLISIILNRYNKYFVDNIQNLLNKYPY